METVKDKIKEKDYFGHPIKIGFMQGGPTYNTVCGGIISILVVKVAFYVYMVL